MSHLIKVNILKEELLDSNYNLKVTNCIIESAYSRAIIAHMMIRGLDLFDEKSLNDQNIHQKLCCWNECAPFSYHKVMELTRKRISKLKKNLLAGYQLTDESTDYYSPGVESTNEPDISYKGNLHEKFNSLVEILIVELNRKGETDV